MSENNNENQNFLEVINDILKTPIKRKNGNTRIGKENRNYWRY